MSRYEPKAFPQYAGLGKVIAFVSLTGGVLGALLGLLIEIVAPSWPWSSFPVGAQQVAEAAGRTAQLDRSGAVFRVRCSGSLW